MSNKERKQRYWQKVYDNAPLIPCKCGCGEMIKSKDHYGRNKSYVNGHNNRKYGDKTQYKREYCHRHREERQAYKSIYGRNRKEKAILLKGSKCNICGIEYNKENSAIFDFHHRIKEKDKIRLNTSNLTRFSWDTILKELEKCDLLCSNCHRLLHFWEDNNTANSDDDCKNK